MKDLDLEIAFMEGVTRRDPQYVEALQILGDNYTRRGRYDEGLKVDERLVELCPRDAMVHYNLACSCALTSQFERSAKELESAIDLGYRDFKWMTRDPDLKLLRADPVYRRIRVKVRELKAKSKT
jgi:tetratricopeptide (TPR) repeat protein